MIKKVGPKHRSWRDMVSKLAILRALVRSSEPFSSDLLDKEVKELRHWVLYTAVNIELELELVIIGNIGSFEDQIELDEREYDKRTIFLIKMRSVLERTDFRRKLDIAREIRAISREVYDKLDKLRRLRNLFAHGLNSELREYENKEKMFDVYEIISNAQSSLKPLLETYKFKK